jgi:O-succinylbenzoate synthase
MIKSYFQKRILHFRKPAVTSRGIMHTKPAWYVYLYDECEPQIKGIGECSIIPGLSVDDASKIESKLAEICRKINEGTFNFKRSIIDFPGINFGVETAFLDLQAKGTKVLFPSDFTHGAEGIKINGLIWMDTLENMMEQVEAKINQGFRCIKLKIGALDFNSELLILKNIRQRFSAKELQVRVDANGAFTFQEAREKLSRLEEYDIHSIEQPIVPTQIERMAELCRTSPVDIALDEELIGKFTFENKRKLIELIHPQYLVLKPGLLGGIKESTDWINIASEFNIGWWVTSALESNIGLNAISQWTYNLGNISYQGLGTGSLYGQNVGSPLIVRGEKIFYDPQLKWNFEFVY